MDPTTLLRRIPHPAVLDGRAACETCCYWHELTDGERHNPGNVRDRHDHDLAPAGQCRLTPRARPTAPDHWCGDYYSDVSTEPV